MNCVYERLLRVAMIAAVLSLSSQSAMSVVLVHEPFDYTAPSQFVGTTLDAVGVNDASFGVLGTYQLLGGSAGNADIVSGSLTGSLPSSGNSLSVEVSHRGREIINRTTPAIASSGLVDGATLIGADGTTLFGSVLMLDARTNKNPFMGLELAAGNDGNRVIVIGDEERLVVYDKNEGGEFASLPLIGAGTTTTQEIIFRIDYGASNVDTITLIDPATRLDGASISGEDLSFSTFHWTGFGGSGPVVWDEFRLGTELLDVAGDIPLAEYRAEINRATGDLTLSNIGVAAGAVIGYTFSSSVGSLDQQQWVSIAENGDVDSGGIIDSNDKWIELSNPNTNTDLSELQVGGPGPDDGVLLTAGQTINLGPVWLQTFTEDVELELLLDDQTTQTVSVDFTGSVVIGNFDRDEDFDGIDFLAWQRDFGSPYGAAELVNWGSNYGTPSASPAIGQLPEPSGCFLLLTGLVYLTCVSYGKQR